METKPTLQVVVCAYRIDESLLSRFLTTNQDRFKAVGSTVLVVSDKACEVELDFARRIEYPTSQSVFNFSKTLNYGIRNSNADIVVKTDIDILFMPGLLERTVDLVRPGRGTVQLCAECRSLNDAQLRAPRWPDKCRIIRSGHGAFFAMAKSDWTAMHGYNENMFGWGGEDNDMYRRAAARIEMDIREDIPLFHIHHPKRSNSFFPMRSRQNMNATKTKYINPDWGSGN